MTDRFIDDVESILRTSQGRRVFREMLKLTGLNKSSFNGQSNHTIFNEGKRTVGLRIEQILKEASFENYIKMQTEEDIYDAK